MKIFFPLFAFAFLIACNAKDENVNALSKTEIATLDSLGFDKSIVAKVKQNVDTTFQVVKMVNNTGQNIPEKFLSKMITFHLNYLMTEKEFEKFSFKNNSNGYNIDKLTQDNTTTIVISKL